MLCLPNEILVSFSKLIPFPGKQEKLCCTEKSGSALFFNLANALFTAMFHSTIAKYSFQNETRSQNVTFAILDSIL